MANFVETKDYTFAQLCKVYGRFKIPNFQRPYSWTAKQIQDFWGSINSNQNPYFVGNMVVVKEKDQIYIVDGQQRLTTINLLLIALRDVYSHLKSKKIDKNKIERTKERIDKYLKEDDLSKPTESEYKRLQLGKSAYQEVFDILVDNKTYDKKASLTSDTQKRLINNYEILKDLIAEEIDGNNIDKLDEILIKTLDLQFIVIACASENDIYGIFEGFNSTGLGLSVADLVKNSILKGSSDDLEVQLLTEELWSELESMFEATTVSRFPKFLRHQWISENGNIQMSNLYKRIKEEKIEGQTPLAIKEYVSLILQEGKVYLGMIYQKYEKNLNVPKDIFDEIVKFRFLQNDQVYEVLLAYYKCYSQNKISASYLKKFLKKLWLFTVRARFVSVNPSEYEKIFAAQCKTVFDSASLDEISAVTDIFFVKLKKLVASKEQFIENFIADVQYDRDNKLITVALSDLMTSLDPEISTSNPEIEHILPQEPKEWGVTKSDIKDYVNKIGNLTLLFSDYNKDNSNKKMAEKNKIFKNSHFQLNNEIESKWSKDFENDFRKTIENRGIDIASRIENLWKI